MTTYQDMIDHLCAWKGITRGTRAYLLARRAVLEAYRDLPQRGSFMRYERKCMLVAEDDVDDGTIEFTYQTRVVELTGATWPDNVTGRRIVIDGQVYPIVERYSDTEIRLHRHDNPGQDYAAGTTYRLINDAWNLPDDFRRVVQVMDVDSQWLIPCEARFSPVDLRFLTTMNAPGQVTAAFVTGGGEWGQSYLYVSPPPVSGTRLSVNYHAQPKPILIDSFAQGTVTLTSGSNLAEFTLDVGVSLPSTVANGCILRVSSGDVVPTGPGGALDPMNGDVMLDNPAAYEFTVVERLDSNTLRLSEEATATSTSKAYVLSDMIDMDATLITALTRMCEANFLRLTSNGSKEYYNEIQRSEDYAQRAIVEARENDRVVQSEQTFSMIVPMWRRPVGDQVT